MSKFLINGFLLVLLLLFATSILSQNKTSSIDDKVSSFDSEIINQHVVEDGEVDVKGPSTGDNPLSELGNRASQMVVEGLQQGVRMILKFFVSMME